MAAFDEAGPALSGVIADVAPDLLIYDVLLPWAQPVARSHGVPAVVFLTVSMAAASLCVHLAKRRGEAHPYGTSYVPGLRSAAEQNARVQPQGKPSGASSVGRCMQSIEGSSDIVLLKSIKELEGKHMEYMESLTGKKVVLVGMPVRDDLDPQQDAKELMDWLDMKERSSTVFISFGSECFLNEEEREEMAYSLELSEVNFIWVIRFPEGEEIKLEDALPGGFLERVGNRGVVVEKWAPQARILAHSSIGGFLSHCGWGSLTEGMRFGVPIIAMPMQNDQPLNAAVVKESGVGVEVGGIDVGRMDRNEIAKAVRHVLVDQNGERVRKKAREMGEIIRNRGDAEIDELVVELNKICWSLKH
ncbi:hypothetical protein MLD38_009845 [Melastoma candidum]|uniref:Uncharacterized protein n=1 Tax=Melastoma candidum TaxID=119954 RepID=A0ACB9S373_9MYRT|nr:hypothetical protein MLD38_009845 [Melastoma candidum]